MTFVTAVGDIRINEVLNPKQYLELYGCEMSTSLACVNFLKSNLPPVILQVHTQVTQAALTPVAGEKS